MNQILQSDWFRERAEFSDLDRGQRNGPRGICVTSNWYLLCGISDVFHNRGTVSALLK